MPIAIDIEPALLRWQAEHGQRITYAELAARAGMSLAALNRLKSGQTLQADLRKINAICKVLECEPADVIFRLVTGEEGTQPSEHDFEERRRILEQVQRLRDEDGG